MSRIHAEADMGHSPLVRPLILTLISICIGGILLVVGGRWNWWEGWIVAGIFSAVLVGSSIWVEVKAPELSQERIQSVSHPGNRHERVILIWVPILLAVTLIVAALDGGRFRWSFVPLWVEIIGFGLFAAYILLNLWTAANNPFLSAEARVQEERSHFVVESGPYQYVRHPMYLGLLLLGLGLPLALGSWWALIPGGLFSLTFVYRTGQEDRLLRINLRGYEEYTHRTPYKLIPPIW